jgi:hypothetical protein
MTVIASKNTKRLAEIVLKLAEISREEGAISIEPDMLKKFQNKLNQIDSYSNESLTAILTRVLNRMVTDEDIEVLKELSGKK